MPMVQTAENCAGSAVAVRLNVVVDISCRGAVADSPGSLTTEIPLLQSIDTVVDFLVVQVLGCRP